MTPSRTTATRTGRRCPRPRSRTARPAARTPAARATASTSPRAAPACDGDPATSCDDPATCAYDAGCPPVLDVSPLTACAPDAHCFDRSLIPTAEQGRFSVCAGGTTLCIPDIFLTTGGKFELAS